MAGLRLFSRSYLALSPMTARASQTHAEVRRLDGVTIKPIPERRKRLMTDGTLTPLISLSNDLVSAADSAGKRVVTVLARRGGGASGVLWRPGLVATADHVVERDEDIGIVLADGSKTTAKLVGRDPTSDLALLSIEGDGKGEASSSSSDPARAGQLVIAVGRPGETGISVSFGSISSVGPAWRTRAGGRIDGLIRPDVTFYPGFSGGPLADVRGQVLGINTSALSRNMSVTIPTTTVDRVIDGLLKTGRISRGYLGLRMQSVTLPDAVRAQLQLERPHALLVMSVEREGPADNAGILMGDVLVGIDGTPVTEPNTVQSLLDPETVGRVLRLRVLRGGVETEVKATVGERPARGRSNG